MLHYYETRQLTTLLSEHSICTGNKILAYDITIFASCKTILLLTSKVFRGHAQFLHKGTVVKLYDFPTLLLVTHYGKCSRKCVGGHLLTARS